MAEKKRLHHFLNDMLKLSCVKGFRHFATHMRGREEMVCSIVNEPSIPIILSATNSPAASFGHHKREAFPMTQKQQRRLSGYGFINVGLPPASPSESEEEDENHTIFLIAGYSRYNRPYVWVRTNHERLVRLTTEEEKDYPLLLQTTSQWQEKDIKVWDVLTELVEVCTAPCPPNPFAVDLDYFESLQLPERALASAAMIAFLQKLIAGGPHHYDRRIQSDLGKLSRIHFQAMLRLLQEGIIQSSPPSASQPQAAAQITQGQKQPPSSVHLTSTASRSQSTAVSSSQSQASSSLPPSSLSHSAQYPTSSSLPPPPPGASSRSTPLYHTAGTAHVPTYPSSAHPQHSLSQPLPPPPASSGGTTYHRSYAAVAGTSVGQVASTEQAPAVTSATGGQFYNRRTGAYNY